MNKFFLTTLAGLTSMSALAGAYQGIPYRDKPHAVPGVIEAEDFDRGGEGISWHDQKPGRQNGGGQVYRETDVDIALRGEGSPVITNCAEGEWTKYTIDVAEDGNYAIETYCISGNGDGYFHFELDGKGVCKSIQAPDGDWGDYSQSVTVRDIPLTKGRHVLTWYTYGRMNVDKFVITRQGKISAGKSTAGNFNYPVTRKMKNPLFVGLDSPMYGTDAVGPLYTADPSAHVWNIDGKEVLYLYASHDMEPHRGCDRMDRYHVFSTEDMKTWTDHGEILSADDVREQAGWGSHGFMWAPDCAYNPDDKTYYFYFPHPENDENWGTTWRIGVATSKYPDRDFKVVGHIEGMPKYIDPCVFVDDDGQPYIYNGGSAHCFGGKLRRDDWTKLDGEMVEMQGLGDFHEATWVHKHGGLYYLSHSDNNNHKEGNHMKYAVSDSPLGPWKDMGIYMYPTGFETNHGSIVDFKGKSYAFYHTANYSGRGALRSVCFDELKYNPDGSIQIVNNWGTPRGGVAPELGINPVVIEAEDYNDGGYHYAYFRKPASTNDGNNRKYRKSDKDMAISTHDGQTYLKGLTKGEWVRYTVDAPEAAEYEITITARSNKKTASRLHVSSNGHNVSGDVSIPAGGWQEVTVPSIALPRGTQYIELRMDAGDVDLDKFIIRKK
ncbi:MAG: family 43 glycosylhydrolase [Bacteroides sp.]|nr:family 43 glycosylhydrolase [Bacteroides sp.]MCM1095273.1 family 43 glycosylhydrolase [Terasakiella sp.]